MLKNKVVVEKAKTVLYLWYLLRKKKDLLKGNFARHLTNPPKNKSNDQNKIFHSKQFVYNQLKFVIFGVQNVQLLSRLFQRRFADLLGSLSKIPTAEFNCFGSHFIHGTNPCKQRPRSIRTIDQI